VAPRVAHLNFSDARGGAHIAALRIHEALALNGIDSTFMVDKPLRDDESYLLQPKFYRQVVRPLRDRLTQFLLPRSLKRDNTLCSPQLLPSRWVKAINNHHCDVVNLHWCHHEMLSIEDLALIKKPIIWTLHDMWLVGGFGHLASEKGWEDGFANSSNTPFINWLRRNMWLRKERILSDVNIGFVVPSSGLKATLELSALGKKMTVEVIPHCINSDSWYPIERSQACQRLELDASKRRVLFISAGGAKDKNKGLDLAITACEKLQRLMPSENFELLVVGDDLIDGMYGTGVDIKSRPFMDDTEDLRSVYSAADLLLFPSRAEAFGLVVQEAMACGTPVVSFRSGGPSEIIRHKENGFIAEGFDSNNFAEGVAWILKDASRRERLSKNCVTHVQRNFSQEVIAKRYAAVYERVCKQHGS
jgi:glycosyltransferase involved in cell wall biosynthesis